MSKAYINNLETGKIELHFEKEEYLALSDDLKKEIKSNFLFSKYAGGWVSRSKNNHYYALKVAQKLGFTEEEIKGERLSYEDELNRKAEKAEARADRYQEYASNATSRAKNLQSDFNSVRGDISFITQPNINSAGGRSFTNYRNKIMARYEKGFEEYRKSDYFKEKAAIAMNTADKTQLKNKPYLCNRIKECKSIIKKYEGYIVIAEEKLLKGEAAAESRIERYIRELEYQMDKQAFMENCLDELGGIFTKDNLEPGYLIKARHGWMKVKKVNPTTVLAQYIETKGLLGIVSKVEYSEIREFKIPDNFKKQSDEIINPYEVGDILAKYCTDGRNIAAAYQVMKKTPKTVLLQEINIGDDKKPIRDGFKETKPQRKTIVKSNYSNFIGVYMGNWELHKYN